MSRWQILWSLIRFANTCSLFIYLVNKTWHDWIYVFWQRIWNILTRHQIILEPKRRIFQQKKYAAQQSVARYFVSNLSHVCISFLFIHSWKIIFTTKFWRCWFIIRIIILQLLILKIFTKWLHCSFRLCIDIMNTLFLNSFTKICPSEIFHWHSALGNFF